MQRGLGFSPAPALDAYPGTGAAAGPGADPAPDDRALAAALHLALLRQPHRGDHAAGMVEVASVLWSRFLRFDSGDPHWPDRDRFVVSAARFAPLLRALLALSEEAAPGEATADGAAGALFGFGQHPGVEMAVGPAGQGIATAAGMAVAERILAARFGHSLVDHRSWVLACETDLSAGVALEAAALAGQMRLDRLTVLFELDLRAEAAAADPDTARFDPMARFAACGWAVRQVDAHDPDAIGQAIASAVRGRKPSLIACVVHRGGAPTDAGDPQLQAPRGEAWRARARRGNGARRGWLKRLARHRDRDEFARVVGSTLPAQWSRSWREAWRQPDLEAEAQADPTAARDRSGARRGLDALLSLLPEFVSLSCEPGLPSMPQLSRPGPNTGGAGRIGRALCLGTQEHGMAALLNGIALHGGLLACGSASFIAVDRMRPALRLAALMRRQVIHLLTHDGLALGEDGAAWQPVEQLASLRAMPNVAVFRPADGAEMMQCWQLALQRVDGPSLIAFSSHIPPDLDERARPDRRADEDGCARGGYLLADVPPGRAREATLIATGPEVGIAIEARDRLAVHGIAAAVVSLPCWELFSAQGAGYRDAVLGSALRVGIEAASGFGWERWLGPGGIFIGIDEYGISAPADELYRQFGITPDAVAARVRRRLAASRPVPPGRIVYRTGLP